MSPTTSTPEAQGDQRVALALAALAEVTDPADVGALVEVVQPEPGVVDLRFACTVEGYPQWLWTVSTSALEGVEPTVLELQLQPGDGALLAPPWVPWTERLAEWRRTHPDESAEPDDEDDREDDPEDDEDVLEADDDLDDHIDPEDVLDEPDEPDDE